MVEYLTEDEKKFYENTFFQCDKDRTGTIKPHDLKAIKSLLLETFTETEFDDLLKEVDTNYVETITLSEFLTMIAKKTKPSSHEEEVCQAFRVFDKDQSGFISANELRHMMNDLEEKLTDEEVDEIIREADANGDGRINYKNFIKMMNNK